MKHYITTLFLMLTLIITGTISAEAKSRVKIIVNTSPEECGEVAVSVKKVSDPNTLTYYQGSHTYTELIIDEATFASVKTETIYLYARAKNNNDIFVSWTGKDKNGNINSNTTETAVTVQGQMAVSDVCTYTFTANFKDTYIRANYNASDFKNCNPTISISKEKNGKGDVITVSTQGPAIGNGVVDSNGNDVANPYFKFSHWETSNGDFISDQNPYTFTVTEPQDLVARYTYSTGFHGKGYYRLRAAATKYKGLNEYVKTVGNIKYSQSDFTINGHHTLMPVMVLTDYKITDADSEADVNYNPFRFDDPGTIFYIDDKNGLNIDGLNNISTFSSFKSTISTGSQTLSTGRGILKSQGVTLSDNFTLLGQNLHFYAGKYPGTIAIRGTLLSSTKYINRYDADHIYGGLSLEGGEDVNSCFELEPVDIEGGEYYFGAMPEIKSEYDGHYYTTMYTAFPYKCLGGVEPYYLRYKAPTEQDTTYYEIVALENGIVPANTAVILKCLDTNAALNRLIPLDPNGSYAAVTDNLLKGVIQLNQGTKNDPSMYQFNVSWAENGDFKKSEAGQYVFMITEEDPEDNEEPWAKPSRISHKWLPDELQSEVCPSNFVKVDAGSKMNSNAAYLDVNQLASNLGRTLEAMPSMLSVIPGKIPTGLKNISVDEPVDNSWYTLSGMRVDHPQKGQIYIHNKKKVIF